ncbi:MAG: GMC family oxidoreductase N-terminal domain-containing protein [Acidimicrobiales bacterium]|nr:GMC family oxidoreductase N-terminal domain-containing protein [Acidimicrobiales bacterium]
MSPDVDVLVIGAGSAGCVLTARLSEDPSCQVVLLEAGPAHALDDRPEELQLLSRPVAWPYDWDDHVTNVDGRALFYGRGRGLGGSSAINGGVAMRPEREDVASWPAGWSWDELLPSMCAIERDLDFGDRPWHGASGPVPIVRWPEAEWTEMQAGFVAGCEAVGMARCADHNEPGTTGVGPIPMNRDGRRRVSVHETHLAPAMSQPNLAVHADALVRRVLVDTGRAVGVELVDGRVLHADRVVIAAGVVQNPGLLWRSGIGPADRLTSLGVDVVADLPVGSHLTDHMVVDYCAEIRPDAIPDGAPSLQTILRATAPGSDRLHDLQLTPWVRRHADGRRELGVSVALQLPDGEGSIEPTGGDLLGPASIRWAFAGLDSNVARLRHGWRLAASICGASGLMLRPADVDGDLARPDRELDELIRGTHTAFYHGVGTCRMGEEGDDRVVDPDGKVCGLESLYVADASIIPTVPRTNTNLAAMTVAEHLAGRWAR